MRARLTRGRKPSIEQINRWKQNKLSPIPKNMPKKMMGLLWVLQTLTSWDDP